MKITQVVIHEIEKIAGKTGATLSPYDTTVDHTDDRVIKLVTELNDRYKNRSETYGVFDKKNQTAFHKGFENYYKENTEDSFIAFTKQAAEDLRVRIDSNSPAKGGYLIFAHYEQNRKFVGVFLVRNTLGLSFKRNSKAKKFDIDNVQHIDFENLAMACRISIDSYKKSEIRYLSFINKKGDDISQYFTRWISSVDTETNESDTNLLLDLLHRVPTPNDPETNQPIDRTDFLDRVYSAVKSTPGRIVNIRNLSETFYGNADYLTSNIETFGISINGEFKAHPKVMKKFIQIRAKADNIELSFPHSAFKTLVRIDQTDKSKIIISSENLANKIQQMINSEE
ncbi:nucleoid-associated protein [Polluticaenibacter yanchengensis]|uniref:Nucleoid-associated protein n=1 Tax=Polluticaenibacter yanchengensis TaxID=3014562 RepID=A0ABT4UPL1_9BACT|nr:nucleoid-associated protein [Chitinophagaceae bacterium LY-5]